MSVTSVLSRTAAGSKGVMANIASRSASLGAAGSLRFELPDTARVRVALTMSARSGSLMRKLPLRLRPALVSANPITSAATGSITTASAETAWVEPMLTMILPVLSGATLRKIRLSLRGTVLNSVWRLRLRFQVVVEPLVTPTSMLARASLIRLYTRTV